jgi:hypothetical protein
VSAYETIPCTECGGPTIAASPVCSLCEADKGLFAPRAAAPAPADPEFSRWWMTPDLLTGHAPSVSLDLGSAQKAWAAARAIPAAAPAPAPKCPMQAFLDKLDSADPAVRAEAEAHAERVADEMSRTKPVREPAPARAQPVAVPGGRFEQVGTVWHERVNDEFHATLDDELVVEGERLYRFVASAAGVLPDADLAPAVLGAWIGVARLPHKATMVVATDFDNYALAYQRYDLGETRWLDAHTDTDRDVPLDFTPTHWLELPGKDQVLLAGADLLGDTLDADYIAKLRDALVWFGESTPESLEECEIYRTRLMRRLIAAVLEQRDRFHAEPPAGAGPLKDHEIRDAVNQLRDVAIQFHHTQQLRSRIQDIVLPLLTRGHQA